MVALAARAGTPSLQGLKQASAAKPHARRLAARPLCAVHTDTTRAQREPRSENVSGQFYVDHTCIDCDTCRWMAPDVFSRVGEQSAVTAQPTTPERRVRALQALMSCPTASIHTSGVDPAERQRAQEGMPTPVPDAPGVYHCGWHDVRTFGGASYLIVRPGGNVLVDSPRYVSPLVKQIEKLGGVKYHFLTHRDDVGEHARWQKHFGSTHIIHSLEVGEGTADVEVKLQGEGPWRLPDGADDIEMIFTPGHTEGHVVLYHAPSQSLLAGDHLAGGHGRDDNGRSATALYVSRDYNWYDFQLQLDSVAKLARLDFRNVLPGHGRPTRLGSAEAKDAGIAELLRRYGRKVEA